MKTIYVILFTMILLPGKAQKLTLQQYRKKVLEYNQDIKQSKEAVNAALYSMKSVKTGFFPKVDLSGNYSYQFENVAFMPGTDLKHDNYSAEAGIVQNIYAGRAVSKQYEMAKTEQAIARLSEDYSADNIVYAADVNYWNVSANSELYDVSLQFVDIVKELYEIVNKRFEEGAISRTDVLMIQSRLKEAELQLNTSETNYKTALQSFRIMMGAGVESGIFPSDSIQMPMPLLLQQGLENALSNRPDYQIALMDVDVAKLQTRLVKAKYLPRLSVGVKEKWGTTLINIDGDKRFSTIAFANLSVPVFYWGERRRNVQVSRAQEQIKELERSKVHDQVNQELNNAWVNLTEALKKIQIINSTLDIARDNLKLNTFSYNEGKLPVIDVLSAQVTWLQAYTNVVSVNYQYKVALAEYIRAQGGDSPVSE